MAGSGWCIAGWLTVMRTEAIDPLKAPRQLVATLTAQASVVHDIRWLEGELTLSACQDHSLSRR